MSANTKRNMTLSALAMQSPDEALAAERAAHAVTRAKLEEAERRITELEADRDGVQSAFQRRAS